MSKSVSSLPNGLFGQYADLEWACSHSPTDNILFFKTKGPLTARSFSVFVRAVKEAAEHFACSNFLLDHRETEFAFRTLDTYDNPQELAAVKLPSDYCAAVVFSKATEQTEFLEIRFRNEGTRSFVFYDPDQAKSWLLAAKEKRSTIQAF